MPLMSTPTWGIPATCSGEGAGLARVLSWWAGDPPLGHHRQAPDATPALPASPQYLRLHHLDAGPRIFRLDQLVHPLRATRM